MRGIQVAAPRSAGAVPGEHELERAVGAQGELVGDDVRGALDAGHHLEAEIAHGWRLPLTR